MAQLLGQPVVTYPPASPQGTTEVEIYAETPLVVNNSNSPHDTEYVIPDGKVLRIQIAIVGAGKDPSEKGSKIELIYHDGTDEHIFDRFYTGNETLPPRIYSDRSTTRDGENLHGSGTSRKLIVRRTRLSSPDHEIDVQVHGYLENIPT